jgi:hypothetical protein
MRSDKKFQSRILLQITVQARDKEAADRRWRNALNALDPARYPGLKVETQVEPYWAEKEELEGDDGG